MSFFHLLYVFIFFLASYVFVEAINRCLFKKEPHEIWINIWFSEHSYYLVPSPVKVLLYNSWETPVSATNKSFSKILHWREPWFTWEKNALLIYSSTWKAQTHQLLLVFTVMFELHFCRFSAWFPISPSKQWTFGYISLIFLHYLLQLCFILEKNNWIWGTRLIWIRKSMNVNIKFYIFYKF